MATLLERAILDTIAWFDVVNYPLTAREIHRYLYSAGDVLPSVQEEDVLRVLQNGTLAQHIRQREVFWHLVNREDIVDVRKRRYEVSSPKWRIAERAVRLLSWLPFVRMIAVVNTVSYHNAKEDSDIDLFIVAEAGRLFTVRFLATVVLDFFRMRRHGVHIQDRACLSFYISNDALSLAPLALPGGDPYLAYWHEWLTPLYDDRDTYDHFVATNQWVRRYIPNAFTEEKRTRLMPLGSIMTAKKRLLEKLLSNTWAGHALEARARRGQMQKFAANIGSRSGDGTSAVIINETMLKFHEADRREEFRRRFAERRAGLV